MMHDQLIRPEAAEQAAECLRTLAHPVRIRLVQQLLQGEFPVGELAEANNIPSNQCSEHLRLMERCGFLRSERRGRQVFYLIAEPALGKLMSCIEQRFQQPA